MLSRQATSRLLHCKYRRAYLGHQFGLPKPRSAALCTMTKTVDYCASLSAAAFYSVRTVRTLYAGAGKHQHHPAIAEPRYTHATYSSGV